MPCRVSPAGHQRGRLAFNLFAFFTNVFLVVPVTIADPFSLYYQLLHLSVPLKVTLQYSSLRWSKLGGGQSTGLPASGDNGQVCSETVLP